jgi:hypothetical protein
MGWDFVVFHLKHSNLGEFIEVLPCFNVGGMQLELVPLSA